MLRDISIWLRSGRLSEKKCIETADYVNETNPIRPESSEIFFLNPLKPVYPRLVMMRTDGWKLGDNK